VTGVLRCLLAFAFALALPAAGSAAAGAPALKAGVFEPPRMAPDFTLPASTGADVTLSAHRGKVVLLGFGFTTCPAVCPITLATLAAARKALGAQAGEVQVVYVTVDPERDDAKRMREYLGAFDASFIGATGTEAQLAAVRTAYGVSAEKVPKDGGDYLYAHSSFVYLIDREGRLRALMPYGRDAADYVHDVRALLASP
jgi:protein SCO1/2